MEVMNLLYPNKRETPIEYFDDLKDTFFEDPGNVAYHFPHATYAVPETFKTDTEEVKLRRRLALLFEGRELKTAEIKKFLKTVLNYLQKSHDSKDSSMKLIRLLVELGIRGKNLKIALKYLKNYSDFVTGRMRKMFPEESRVVAMASRAVGDPNRRDGEEAFRDTDFNGNSVWLEGQGLSEEEKRFLLEGPYYEYHQATKELIDRKKKENPGVAELHLFAHDTGDVKLNNETGESGLKEEGVPFPLFDIGYTNKYIEEEFTCHPRIAELFMEKLKENAKIAFTHLFTEDTDFKNRITETYKKYVDYNNYANDEEYLEALFNHKKVVTFNDPYGAGHIPSIYSDPKPSSGGTPVHGLQLEMARCMYLDEGTQKVHQNIPQIIAAVIRKTTEEVGHIMKDERQYNELIHTLK